jgi:hypothetical protein
MTTTHVRTELLLGPLGELVRAKLAAGAQYSSIVAKSPLEGG